MSWQVAGLHHREGLVTHRDPEGHFLPRQNQTGSAQMGEAWEGGTHILRLCSPRCAFRPAFPGITVTLLLPHAIVRHCLPP